MRLWTRVRTAIRWVFCRSQCEGDLEEELRFALAELAARHERGGLSRQAAMRAARLQLGHAEGIKTQVRDFTSFERLWQDLRYAVRGLVRSPGFAVVACMALALGICAPTAIFTVVRSVLLRPLPFPEADRLVMLWERQPHTGRHNVASMSNFRTWQDSARRARYDGRTDSNGS